MDNTNLVVYKNDMNTVPLRNFSPKEMDLFFAICSQMRERGLNRVVFSFDDLRYLSNYKITAIKHFVKDLEAIYNKLLQISFKVGTSEEFTRFTLFTKYTVSFKNQTIEIAVNEEFSYILNRITSDFTRFELEEFTNLRSSYAKTAYRLLKQFRSTGIRVFIMDDFRRLLSIPDSYKMCDIDRQVIKPIIHELKPIFKELKVEKKAGRKTRKIERITFSFTPEKEEFIDSDGTKYDNNLLTYEGNCTREKYSDIYALDCINDEQKRRFVSIMEEAKNEHNS